MRELHADIVINMLKIGTTAGVLQGMGAIAQGIGGERELDGISIPPNTIEQCLGACDYHEALCAEAELKITVKHIRRVRELLQSENPSLADLESRLQTLGEVLEDELEDLVILRLDGEEGGLYREQYPMGEDVYRSFPSARYDATEAARCLALHFATACVFHLMRAVESGLNVLAAKFGVVGGNPNWQHILSRIDREITLLESQAPAGWRDEKEFYSAARRSIDAMKDPIRNSVMHVRSRYDPDKAREIFFHVRTFLVHLSAKLQEAVP